MEYAADKADIFVTTTGNKSVIRHEHMAAMKNNAIVCNIGHFDNEIDVAALEQYQWEEIKPQVDHVIFPDGKRIILLAKGRLVNLGCGTGHPSYVMSSSFANQTIAQIELFAHKDAYDIGKVYVLPKHLDEKVARLQLTTLNAQLTELTEEQAAYIGVPKQGPYKPDTYRWPVDPGGPRVRAPPDERSPGLQAWRFRPRRPAVHTPQGDRVSVPCADQALVTQGLAPPVPQPSG